MSGFRLSPDRERDPRHGSIPADAAIVPSDDPAVKRASHYSTFAQANGIAVSLLALEDGGLEPMRLIIEQIRRAPEAGLLIARVRAVSEERISGAPRAVLRMRIRLPDPGPDTSRRDVRRLARDEALRFLDIE